MTIISGGTERDRRVHILKGADWARSVGTDFWLIGGPNEETAATGAGLRTLDAGGWTAPSIDENAGSGADFLSSADDGPPNWGMGAASDLIQSPSIFGNYSHAYMAQQFLGHIPTELNLEIYAQHVDGTNNETASGFGFVEDGGSIVTANDAMAVIYSDGTNFKCRSGAAATAAGAADDTSWHLWRIQVAAAGIYWYIDGTVQNSTVLALQTDEWPCAFGIGVQAGGSNFLKMAWAHIWYS